MPCNIRYVGGAATRVPGTFTSSLKVQRSPTYTTLFVSVYIRHFYLIRMPTAFTCYGSNERGLGKTGGIISSDIHVGHSGEFPLTLCSALLGANATQLRHTLSPPLLSARPSVTWHVDGPVHKIHTHKPVESLLLSPEIPPVQTDAGCARMCRSSRKCTGGQTVGLPNRKILQSLRAKNEHFNGV